MRRGRGTGTRCCCRCLSGYSPQHPDTLTVRAILARWTGEAGDAAGARDQCAALLPVLEQVLGSDAPGSGACAPNSPVGPSRWEHGRATR